MDPAHHTDFDDDPDLPGAGFDFQDVTSLFEDAAADMTESQMLFMEGFTLQDAMSAFEIGEPRLDSGYIPPGQQIKQNFNPLAPLLPEELCWIIDRSFSYEVEWHNGNFMSHTVLAFLYIHHLDNLDPDHISTSAPFMVLNDRERPPEYLTVVIRAVTCGLLKCCDLIWRELSKGAVQDTEDWQSDKCEVSLLEGTHVKVIIKMLEEASIWVSDSYKVPDHWKEPLIYRLQFRKAFLQLLDTNVHRYPTQFKSYIAICQEFIQKIRSYSIPEPSEDSTIRLAFDPYVSRRLNTAIPIRVIPMGSIENTWDTFATFFDQLSEISRMSTIHSPSTWKVIGNLRSWTSKSPIPQPYIRSLTQSTFYDGVLVFDRYAFIWIIDRFFYETIGITWNHIQSVINERWLGDMEPPFDLIEHDLYAVLIPNIRNNWSNPARRRRNLVKKLVTWHTLYDVLSEILMEVHFLDIPSNHFLPVLPQVALSWRLSSIREIILSGFQIELYVPEEKTFAYWYLVQLCEEQLKCYDRLLPVIPLGTPAYKEMIYDQQVTTALQALCSSLFIMTIPLLSFEWNRTISNFFRRFKWAFKSEYDNIDVTPVGHPDLSAFMSDCWKIVKDANVEDLDGKVREGVELGKGVLMDLVDRNEFGGFVRDWVGERKKFIEDLISTINNLSPYFDNNSNNLEPIICSIEELDLNLDFDMKNLDLNQDQNRDRNQMERMKKSWRGVKVGCGLKWDVDVHPWFPVIDD